MKGTQYGWTQFSNEFMIFVHLCPLVIVIFPLGLFVLYSHQSLMLISVIPDLICLKWWQQLGTDAQKPCAFVLILVT